MANINSLITQNLKSAYLDAYGLQEGSELIKLINFGGKQNIDYTLRSLIGIQKILKKNKIDDTIDDIYGKITSKINKEYFNINLVNNYINISINNNHIVDQIKNLLNLGIQNKPLLEQTKCKKKILVDFSSPNIAKDMHVGHLRSTIIGDSICRLFELQGHEVLRINHIGDFGLQFGMIIEHLLQKCPDYDQKSLTIENLQTFYAESKKRFDTDEGFKKNAYHNVVRLQSGEPEIVRAWNYIKDVSRQAYNQIYDKLEIKLTEVGESFYQNLIPSTIQELKEQNLLQEDNGRMIIKVEGHEMPLTVIKSDGGFTYDTTDLAAIRYRMVDLNVDLAVYVVDNGQSEHFEMIFKTAKKMGWIKENQMAQHVGFGVILGEDGKKFKSRSGDTVKLDELLNESLENAEKILNEHRQVQDNINKQHIIKNVAFSSIKYADLASVRTNDYKFSFNKMLSLKGNTGAYQLYEYVRICGILRNVTTLDKVIESINLFDIKEPEEINLCKKILLLPEIIDTVNHSLMFHTLCSYLYDLSISFSSFHTKCRCLQYENKKLISVDNNRILICMITKLVFENCFQILGMKTLERM